MGLAWPLALVGLLSLAIPLGIHLLQRGAHNTVEIATTRFVPEEERPQWRWTQLREPWLWLLRTLLVLAAVILLAEPYGQQSPDASDGETVTLVSPRVAADIARTLANDQDNLRWLAPGFPDLSTQAPEWRRGQLWGNLWSADQTLPSTLQFRVIAPPQGVEIGASRPALGRAVEWIAAPVAPTDTPSATALHIVHDAKRAADAAHLYSIVDGWRRVGLPISATLTTPSAVPSQARHVIWLSDAPWSDFLSTQHSGVIVSDTAPAAMAPRVVQRNEQRKPIVFEASDGARIVRTIAFRLAKQSDEVRDPNFAVTLAQAVFPRFGEPTVDDLRIADALAAPRKHSRGVPELRRSKTSSWIPIVLVLAALERLLAGSRRRKT